MNDAFGRSRDYLKSVSRAIYQTLDEFRVNSVQGDAPGQFVPFPCSSIRGKQNKYAVSIAY